MAESEKDVKEAILNAAANVFAKYGYIKTTMNDIAATVKKGKSSLYHYFPGKEQVFQAVLDKEFGAIKSEVEEAISKENTPQKKLSVFISTRMYALHNRANFYSALKDEFMEHFTFIEKFRETYDQIEQNTIKNLLVQGINEGTFGIKDVDTTAFGIFFAMKGIEYSWIVAIDAAQKEKILSNMLEILFYGINKR